MSVDPLQSGARRRVVLVTGAARGIGLAVARAFARRGAVVYAGTRARPPDGAAADPALEWLELDVTDAVARAAAIERIERAHGRLDVLVNSAGTLRLGAVEDLPEAVWREVMEVNFFAPLLLTQRVLPLMRRRGGGTVIMLSSLSGLVGLPTESAYAASKFALEGAAEALRHEVAPFGIKVAVIEPGAVATEFTERAIENAVTDSVYADLVQLRQGSRSSDDAAGMTPEEVAQIVVQTVDAGVPWLRVPAGAQAEAVVGRLACLDAAGRTELVRQVAHLEAWQPVTAVEPAE